MRDVIIPNDLPTYTDIDYRPWVKPSNRDEYDVHYAVAYEVISTDARVLDHVRTSDLISYWTVIVYGLMMREDSYNGWTPPTEVSDCHSLYDTCREAVAECYYDMHDSGHLPAAYRPYVSPWSK